MYLQEFFIIFLALEPLAKLINMTKEYTMERKIFGRPILDNQVVQFRLAELETELECLRSMTYRAVSEYILSSY